MDGSQSADQGLTVNSDHFTIRKVGLELLQDDFISRGVVNRNKYGRVADVKIGMAGGVAVMRSIRTGRHGHLNHLEWLSLRVLGMTQALQIFGERGMVHILGVRLHHRRHHSRGEKTG